MFNVGDKVSVTVPSMTGPWARRGVVSIVTEYGYWVSFGGLEQGHYTSEELTSSY